MSEITATEILARQKAHAEWEGKFWLEFAKNKDATRKQIAKVIMKRLTEITPCNLTEKEDN